MTKCSLCKEEKELLFMAIRNNKERNIIRWLLNIGKSNLEYICFDCLKFLITEGEQ